MSGSDDISQRRSQELAKYDAIYSGKLGGKWNRYGGTNHWKPIKQELISRGIASATVCDVGTGKGDFPKWCVEQGSPLAVGCDFAMQTEASGPGWMLLRAPGHEIPLDDGAVEYVTAFDMLEHCLPEEVPDVLREFRRISKIGAVFSIAYRASVSCLGTNLHPTVRPERWWIEQIYSHMRAAHVERVGKHLVVLYDMEGPPPHQRVTAEYAITSNDILLIGNGPGALGLREQDVLQAGTVVRFNAYRTEPFGFSAEANARCHVWSINNTRQIRKEIISRRLKLEYLLAPNPSAGYMTKTLKLLRSLEGVTISVIDDDTVDTCRQLCTPSTGTLTLMHYIKSSNNRIVVAGFDGVLGSGARGHYFESCKSEKGWHSTQEREVFSRYVKDGRVIVI